MAGTTRFFVFISRQGKRAAYVQGGVLFVYGATTASSCVVFFENEAR